MNYTAAIAAALNHQLGQSHQAVKTLMRWTNASERTVKNWLEGRHGPQGAHLVLVLRHSDAALNALLELAQREQIVALQKMALAREAMADAVAALDECFRT